MPQRVTRTEPQFRLARASDVEAILPFALATVPGFVEALWTDLAAEGETAMDFGRRAQLAFIEDAHTVVAELGGKVVAMLITYPMADNPDPHVPGYAPMLEPLVKQFALAAGTWYLHGIATDPDHAGTGLGSRLMALAEQQARDAGKTAISLLVIDTNTHAIRYYEKRGYRVVSTRPVVKGSWPTKARAWLLMTKPVT